ncbi:MAG: HAMP domain-containing histidine kinase [Bacteroidales bacterium]|nr:HAMP domain-containing histidine kinase [Bacteroidales bacterium]MCF8387901.1 HAMP domain-containing histidine kinase [Bacteroidales bacterium]MCF8398807.1 HAMP domain-containing histidine kinase [Bacteroidales bacterium]
MKFFKDKILLSGIILIVIIVVPSFIFSLYQYGSIDTEEEVIEDVYENQLDAILLSINQYSTDILNAWVKDLNQIVNMADIGKTELESFFSNRKQIIAVYARELDSGEAPFIAWAGTPFTHVSAQIEDYINSNEPLIARLKEHLESNYQQVLGFDVLSEKTNLSGFVFLMKDLQDNIYVGVIIVNTNRFIDEIISPKIQETAGNKMNIVVYHNTTDEIIYANNANADIQVQKSKELWLMPNYFIGIELPGKTLDDLVNRRVTTIIVLIVLFNLILITGIWYLFRNIKRERELIKIRSDFVSNVSHEIRTPLSMISMFTETLKLNRIKDENKKKEYYNIIYQETKRLTGIVNNLLNFAKMENNKRVYTFGRESLNDIVRDIFYTYKFDLEKKGFVYESSLDENLSHIDIDKDAVTDALVNLLNNAIKYSAEEKFIKISTGKDNKKQFIAIEDRGIGIPERDQKHIFDKFYRVTSGDLAQKAEGSGLGLSIVKHIMEAHQGEIVLNSKLNEGTKVILYFPDKTENNPT